MVHLVRTSSSLDHEGMPDVYGVYAEEHLAHAAILHEWPHAKKVSDSDYEISKYDTASVEPWAVISSVSEFVKVY
jgi:hypothetical protein